MPTGRRPALLLTAALVAATVLAGCSRLDQLAGGPVVPSAEPSATATPTSAGASPTPSATLTPTSSPTPTPSATPSATPTATPSPTPSTPASLSYGSTGAQVLELQQRLTALGYWLGTPDGRFGSLTQQAVFALQKSAGLSRDGVVGPRTRAALAAGTRPRATLSGDGVEIDLRRQVLMVVRKGRPVLALNTSTGSGEQYTSNGHTSTAYTPTGSFTVFRQVDGQDDSDLGELWRPKYFYRGWAVHGSPSIPPYPASHGCARLSNAAIDMIWAEGLMPIGSRVLVR